MVKNKRISRKESLSQKHKRELLIKIWVIAIISMIILVLLVMYTIPIMVKIADGWNQVGQSDKLNNDSTRLRVPLYRPRLDDYGYSATNSATLVITGKADPGASIKITLNGSELNQIVSDSSGIFSMSGVKLVEGANTISAKAFSKDGRSSEQSKQIDLNLDTVKPTLDISSPSSDTSVSGFNNSIIEVRGSVDGAENVFVNDDRVVLNDDGTFVHKYLLNSGDNELNIYAEDEAKNRSTTITRKINYTP